MAQSTGTEARQPADLAPDLARADDLPLGAQLAWRLRVRAIILVQVHTPHKMAIASQLAPQAPSDKLLNHGE